MGIQEVMGIQEANGESYTGSRDSCAGRKWKILI
jgi:hypothetical protein